MRKSKFSEEQIIGILKEHQAGLAVSAMSGASERSSRHINGDSPFAGSLMRRFPA